MTTGIDISRERGYNKGNTKEGLGDIYEAKIKGSLERFWEGTCVGIFRATKIKACIPYRSGIMFYKRCAKVT